MDDLTAQQLLARTARAQRDGRLPSLAAGVVREGLAWFAGRGRVDGHAPTPDTQYRIGSVTKTFTAVLVMQLRDEGRLRLDDPVADHVPDCGLGRHTVGQLLTHTAGLPAETDGAWWERVQGGPWSQLRDTVGRSSRRHRGAGEFHYSNLGFAVLGELIARYRQQSWWDALSARILQPLELRRTTYEAQPPAAGGWAVHPWADVVLAEPTHDAGAMAPAGQLWSTTGDLARWATFLLGDTGGVLATDTVEEMCQPLATYDLVEASAWGLGLNVSHHDGRVLVGHGGSMPGFACGLDVDRDEGTAAIALSNATVGLDGELTVDLLRIVREHEPAVVDEWLPEPGLPALDLVGVWYWGSKAYALRSGEDGRMELLPVDGQGRRSRLEPVAEDRWVGLDGYYAGEPLEVVRDADGRPAALNLASFVLTRQPYAPGEAIPGGVDTEGWRPLPE